ncbi:hypothetical protein B0682_03355 [Moraxella lincolnii]|uniref:Uncharacterized protein n=1 Tax=Lwoffella lincolnii TaxID=90241 RepID=A0A1T0CHA5_9GAMM|nr:hypothetical protein B0682_03355 [Moraxella lincolnii]
MCGYPQLLPTITATTHHPQLPPQPTTIIPIIKTSQTFNSQTQLLAFKKIYSHLTILTIYSHCKIFVFIK